MLDYTENNGYVGDTLFEATPKRLYINDLQRERGNVSRTEYEGNVIPEYRKKLDEYELWSPVQSINDEIKKSIIKRLRPLLNHYIGEMCDYQTKECIQQQVDQVFDTLYYNYDYHPQMRCEADFDKTGNINLKFYKYSIV